MATYTGKLDTLIDNINALQTQINSPSTNVVANPANMTSMDLDSQQQYQMFQIDYLSKQIKNAQDVINAQNIANTTQNYKPIKVFSSCVVSNANGTTTNDQPVNNYIKSLSPSQSTLSSPATQQMMQTIGQGQSIPLLTQPFINLSPNTGAIGSFLSNISSFDGINVNT